MNNSTKNEESKKIKNFNIFEKNFINSKTIRMTLESQEDINKIISYLKNQKDNGVLNSQLKPNSGIREQFKFKSFCIKFFKQNNNLLIENITLNEADLKKISEIFPNWFFEKYCFQSKENVIVETKNDQKENELADIKTEEIQKSDNWKLTMIFNSQDEVNQIISHLKNNKEISYSGSVPKIFKWNKNKICINFCNNHKMVIENINQNQFNLDQLFKIFPNWVLERYYSNQIEKPSTEIKNEEVRKFNNIKHIKIIFKSQDEVNQIISHLKNNKEISDLGPLPKSFIQKRFKWNKNNVYINFCNNYKMLIENINQNQFNLDQLFKIFPNWVAERYYSNQTAQPSTEIKGVKIKTEETQKSNNWKLTMIFSSQDEINQIIYHLKNDCYTNSNYEILSYKPIPENNIQEQFELIDSNKSKIQINFYENNNKMIIENVNQNQSDLNQLFKKFPNWVSDKYYHFSLNQTKKPSVEIKNNKVENSLPKIKNELIKKNQNENQLVEIKDEQEKLNHFYIGCDESGKGEWSTNLTIAVCCCDKSTLNELKKSKLITDSKKIAKENFQETYLKLTTILDKKSYVVAPLSMEKYNQYYDLFRNQDILLTYLYSIAILKLRNKIVGQNQELGIKFDQSEKIIDAFTTRANFQEYINQIHQIFRYDPIKLKHYDDISDYWFEPLKPASYFKFVEKAETQHKSVAAASILAKWEVEQKWIETWNPIETLLPKPSIKGSTISRKDFNNIIKIFQQQKPNLSRSDIIQKHFKSHFKIK
ncbi:Ribonuclease HIII [[Mycoplasma] cavipharyngis]|uniref:hypothetical protein n=1 Tax=[Mycoplasma] cavipharyngis TaxID=92757 RepID=UPI003703FEEF